MESIIERLGQAKDLLCQLFDLISGVLA